ncbi:hypothetical protein CGMCC3_g8517 [Colletotrichum fructicola]|uniref:Uncharacterized protein n=1 Tax=Colletotrichum fructicola (strain Nara gc5) TaxID=1213859 RepID=A0A7J6IMD3_COLFN|nr:uncharacterized protein CGMCC3_g8517 [Colletotrichum fructicola]KAE9575181.1 hypothetical protein CGMCC3_g8517 [Colletotrichum fructicola]KAF4477929.1 hypothetical protein CGGC5_v013337 [Colletotrichum fructicola Nara gc5]
MGGPECTAWIPLEGPDYCVSRSLEEQCNLVVDTRFLAIVVGCNLLKLLGLAATWLCLKKRPLLTIGDAMESFLTQPDITTRGCGMMCISFFDSPDWNDQPTIWIPKRRLWAGSVSFWRYCSFLLLWTTALGTSGVFLIQAFEKTWEGYDPYNGVPSSSSPWEKGLGTVSLDCLIGGQTDKGSAGTALLVNSPQLIMSMIYDASERPIFFPYRFDMAFRLQLDP